MQYCFMYLMQLRRCFLELCKGLQAKGSVGGLPGVAVAFQPTHSCQFSLVTLKCLKGTSQIFYTGPQLIHRVLSLLQILPQTCHTALCAVHASAGALGQHNSHSRPQKQIQSHPTVPCAGKTPLLKSKPRSVLFLRWLQYPLCVAHVVAMGSPWPQATLLAVGVLAAVATAAAASPHARTEADQPSWLTITAW